jgi:hypothetical protein
MSDITGITNLTSASNGADSLTGIKAAVTNLNNEKAVTASPTFTGTVTTPAIVVSSETASTVASFDASKNIKSLALATYPSLTELSYVKGATSALQTQITAKAPSTAPTFATSITGSYLTPSEILGTGASKEIVSLPVATYPSLTELSYVKGVTSAIQTQLNAKANATTYKNGVTTYDLSTATGTQNIAHGLGIIPKKIRITTQIGFAGTIRRNIGVYNGTTTSTLWSDETASTGIVATDTTNIIKYRDNNNGDQQFAVGTFDATNIILSWTKSGTPSGTLLIMWEAQG